MSSSSTSYSAASLRAAFISICFIFFMVGFAQFTTGTLVDYLQKLFTLSNLQAQFISLAFFIAYFVMAIPAERLLTAKGYKYGIITGLVVCGLGAALFIPASMMLVYWAFLGAVLTLGLGVATLQVGINPYVAVLGDEKTAASRVSIANGCTALGSILAPQAAKLLFSQSGSMDNVSSLSQEELLAKASIVQMPFMVVAGIFLMLGLFLFSQRLPEVGAKQESGSTSSFSLGNYPWLVAGVVTLFIYMGGQIAVINLFFKPYLVQRGGLTLAEANDLLSVFFLLQMIGRFGGSALMQKMRANYLLMASAAGMVLCILAATVAPASVLWLLFVALGLFDAVCFGNIFSLAIAGLGEHTKKGSSMLFMAVLGGAILPAVIGAVVDAAGMNTGMLVAATCYVVVLWYGVTGYKMGQVAR